MAKTQPIRSIRVLLLGLFLSLIGVSCSLLLDETRSVERYVERILPSDSQKMPPAVSANVAIQSRVYIDRSQSMQGYCGDGHSQYSEVLEHLVSGLVDPELYGFGVFASGLPPEYTRVTNTHVLSQTGFYTALSNPDAALYRHIADDTTHDLSLYVSDGVQSAENTATLQPTNDALEALFHKGFAIAVLVYRSPFRGRMWSESLNRFGARQTIPNRPFYVFAIGRTPQIIDVWLEERLSKEISPDVLFRFGPSAVQLKTAKPARVNQRLAFKTRNIYAPDRQGVPKDSSRSIPICEYSYDYAPNSAASVDLQLDCRVVGWGKIKGDSLIASGRELDVAFTASPTKLTLSTPRGVRRLPSGVLDVQLSARSIGLSSAVRELSTEDDGSEGDHSRTYRFAWLMERLVQAQLAHYPVETRIFVVL